MKIIPIRSRMQWQLLTTICSTLVAIYIPLNIVLKLDQTTYVNFFYWFITIVFSVDVILHLIQPSIESVMQIDIKTARSKY